MFIDIELHVHSDKVLVQAIAVRSLTIWLSMTLKQFSQTFFDISDDSFLVAAATGMANEVNYIEIWSTVDVDGEQYEWFRVRRMHYQNITGQQTFATLIQL